MSNIGLRERSPIIDRHMTKYNRDEGGVDESADISAMSADEVDRWRADLFNYNMPFAIKEASKYRTSRLDINDLIQESLRGLHEASLRFDPTMNNRFITYAVWWIRAYVQEYVASFASDVRIPRNAWLVAEQARRGVTVSTAMQRHTGEIIDAVNEVRGGFASLDAPLKDMDGATIGDAIVGDRGRQADEMDDETLRSDVRRFLDSIQPRHASVVADYYGLLDRDARCLEHIKGDYGVSRERVRQIREEALDEVRDNKGGRYNYLWEHADERLDRGSTKVEVGKSWRARRAKKR